MAVQALYKKGDSVYVEIFNELHHISNPDTLTGVFGSKPSITNDLPPYPIGFEINPGSCLVRSKRSGRVFLMTNGLKYYVTSPEAMQHYQLNGTLFPVNSDDQILADKLIDMTASGKDISS